MAGLISGALAGLGGAATAGGDYLAKSSLLEQQGKQTLDLETIKNEMAEARETALQELRGSQEKERQTTDIASREKIAGAHDKVLRDSFQRQGLSVQTDAEGNMGVADLKSRTFKPFVDDDGEPIKGLKDLPLSVKTYVTTLSDRLKAIDKEEAGGMTQGDVVQRRRAELNAQLLGVLTTGKLPSGAASQGGPSAEDIAGLRQRANNPSAVKFFENRYGQGSSQSYLRQDAGELDPGRFTTSAPTPTKKDPITGESLTKVQWEKKFGKDSWEQ